MNVVIAVLYAVMRTEDYLYTSEHAHCNSRYFVLKYTLRMKQDCEAMFKNICLKISAHKKSKSGVRRQKYQFSILDRIHSKVILKKVQTDLLQRSKGVWGSQLVKIFEIFPDVLCTTAIGTYISYFCHALSLVFMNRLGSNFVCT